MSVVEKRKFGRVKTHNLISYVCLDNDGRPIANLMGIALDISQGGLLLETTQQIEPRDIVLVAADEKERIVEIKAKAVYCREVSSGKFHVGVSFRGTYDENIRFAKCVVRAYHYRKISCKPN
jgi:hypothetical protein